MSTQIMSLRLQAKYMRIFIDETKRINKRSFLVKTKAVRPLAANGHFNHHLRILQGLGLISVYWINGERDPLEIAVTKDGMAFFERRAREMADQRWTRGLAIIAIIVSLAALALEFDDRGYLDWAKSGRTHEAQSMQTK